MMNVLIEVITFAITAAAGMSVGVVIGFRYAQRVLWKKIMSDPPVRLGAPQPVPDERVQRTANAHTTPEPRTRITQSKPTRRRRGPDDNF